MREFEHDPETTVHPQTVIQHFGSWNEAKRKAGLVPRRFAKPADLIRLLRELGEELGRPPTAKDLDEHRDVDAVEVALLAHVRLAEERAPRSRLRRAGGGGAARTGDRPGRSARPKLGRLPKFADWTQAREARRRADERVADLPDARARARAHGPRSSTSSASGCSRMEWRCRRKGGFRGGGDRREAPQTGNALVRRAHGRERRLLESAVGREALALDPATLDERNENPLGELPLAELQVQIALDDLEGVLGRREERFATCLRRARAGDRRRARRTRCGASARRARPSPSIHGAPRARLHAGPRR